MLFKLLDDSVFLVNSE